MSGALYFVQQCPTCGRQLEVRVMYLGRNVVCRHCRGTFLASDPDNEPAAHDSGEEVLLRANELLESAEAMKRRPR
jgi:DNA-directed RNA polymerase subunit RPC12/RpoP